MFSTSHAMTGIDETLQPILATVIRRDADEAEFHQAVHEMVESLGRVVAEHPHHLGQVLIERICEPERRIFFRIPWIDDRGRVRINCGFRDRFNSALVPYKGAMRFHPSVNVGIVTFLGFEQTFRNALTGMPIGGGKARLATIFPQPHDIPLDAIVIEAGTPGGRP